MNSFATIEPVAVLQAYVQRQPQTSHPSELGRGWQGQPQGRELLVVGRNVSGDRLIGQRALFGADLIPDPAELHPLALDEST